MVPEKVIDNIKEHNINGDVFLKLNETDLREVASPLCDRVLLRSLQNCLGGRKEFIGTSQTPVYVFCSYSIILQVFFHEQDMNISTSFSSPPSSSKTSSNGLPITPKRNIMYKSPDKDDSWVDSFEIPKLFSARTQDCISTGILTQSCRTEIVQTIVAHMWVHGKYPSQYAYNTVCSKLVKAHPSLEDDAGDDEVAHVSGI